MAYFTSNFRSFSLPDNCPFTAVNIYHASKSHPAAPFARKKMAKEIEILDDEMQSRYDKLHGQEGLCCALVELVNAMGEIRMKAEYGDYLAYTCSALKGEGMDDMLWKIETLDWQEVADRIEKEESAKAEREARRLAIAPTPYLDNVSTAAARLGYDFDFVRYQIFAYADRNNFCHSGLKAMIHHGDFQDLAERLMHDKGSLEVIFRGNPHAQMEVRQVIKVVDKEWFSKIWVDERRKGHAVKYVLTDKALEKMRKLAALEEARRLAAAH